MAPLTRLYLNNTERKQFKVCFKSCFYVNLNVFAQVTHSVCFFFVLVKPIRSQLKKRNEIWKDFRITSWPHCPEVYLLFFYPKWNLKTGVTWNWFCWCRSVSRHFIKVVKMSRRVCFLCAISQDAVSDSCLNLLLNVSLLEKSSELVLIFWLFTLFSFPTAFLKMPSDIRNKTSGV